MKTPHAAFALTLVAVTQAVGAASPDSPGAHERHLVPQKTFAAIAGEYSGERAKENVRQLIGYHRIQGSPMMAKVAKDVVLSALASEGIESSIEQFDSDGKIRYGTFISPMGWDMRGGELWVESVAGDRTIEPLRLCRYADVPMCVATYSKGGNWSGELVDVGQGTGPSSFEGKDVRGKVALAYGYAGDVVREAVVNRGAIGAVIYPSADDRPDHPDMIRYHGIWPRAEELGKTSGAFMISANQYAQLQAWMRRGPVRVRGNIDADLGAGKLTLVHAWIRGTEEPQQEVILTAHLDHPKWSANDNASGSGGMLELARTLSALVKSGRLAPPKRTIHFIWVPEWFGSSAWLMAHPEVRACGPSAMDPRKDVEPWDERKRQPCTLANLNLDMIGENNRKLGTEFQATRTPDSVPSFLNALLADTLEQTKNANLTAATGTRGLWYARQAPLALGSDHELFLGIGVPASMFWHTDDWTHHSSEDTLDNVDPTEFLRVCTLAGGAAWWMANATDTDWAKARRAQARQDVELISARVADMSSADKVPALAEAQQVNRRRLADATGVLTGSHSAASARSNASFNALPANSRRGGSARPARTTILPIYGAAYEGMNESDEKWWAAKDSPFAGRKDIDPAIVLSEGLSFMDGTRTFAEVARLLSAEFLVVVDARWVEQLSGVLQRRGVVEFR